MISICWLQFIYKNYNEAYVNFGIMTMTMMRSQLASMIMLMTMTIMIILQLASMIMMITMTMIRITASINDYDDDIEDNDDYITAGINDYDDDSDNDDYITAGMRRPSQAGGP